MTLAILLLGLIVATCFIAYLADTLGKNLGKKRVSLQLGRWSLRPRQTATLISMAASVGIMLLTVAILLLTSGSLSNALLRYDEEKRLANRAREQAIQERTRAENLSRQLQDQILSKRKLLRESDIQLSQLQKTLRGTNTQLRSTQTRLASAQRARSSAESARRTAIRSASQARQSAARAQRNLHTALARYANVRRQLTGLRSQLQDAQDRVTRASRQLKEEQHRVANSRNQLEKVRSTLDSTRSQLQEAKAGFEDAQAAYDQAQSSLKTVNEEVKKQLADYRRVEEQKAQLEASVKQLQNIARELDTKAQLYASMAGMFAAGDFAIRQGTVFTEKTVAPHASTSQYRALLQEVLQDGRSSLQDILKDTKSTPRLYPLPIKTGNQVVELEGEEILNHLSEYLTTFDTPIAIRLTAVRNHLVGETEIDSQFWIVPVRTIYVEGETLAEIDVSATAGDARIFNQLLALLNDAEKTMRARGAMPVPTKANPYFFATGTNERIFDALRRIQALGTTAHVRLIAAEDVATTKPVRVRFEVTRG